MAITCLIGVANKAIGYPDPPGPPTIAAPSTILCEKLVFALQILQLFALTLIKCSALAFYRRVFCTVRPSLLNTVIWILIIITTAWGIGFIGFYAGSCGSHPSAAWQGNIPFIKYCRDITPKFEQAFAASDFILDSFVLIIPIPSIWHLRMTKGRKVGITGIFMLALIGYGVCIARLESFVILAVATFSQKAPDIQTADTQAIWYSMLETGFTLIAVNLPSLWSLIAKVSVGSIVALVRSVISLRSTPNERTGGSNLRSYVRKNSIPESQDIELVAPEDKVDLGTTIERQKDGGRSDHEAPQNDLESGIYVQKSLQMSSREPSGM
ncbi:hypothetical protein ACMFMG_004773 [Clarireedia jacksonii]